MAAGMFKNRHLLCTAISSFVVRNATPKVFENRHCMPKMLARMAGHSHWQNIKFKKAHKDFQRSKIFGKLAMEIIATVRAEGGSDPALNSRLARIVERAKVAKMPKDSIENAVKSGAGTKNNPYQYTMFEVRGPGASGLLIDVLTTNKVKVKSEMATILRKNGGAYKGGSVSFQFDSKGIVTLKDFIHDETEHTPETYPDENAFNQAEEVAIEVGAENLYFTISEEDKIVIKFICDIQDLKNVSDALTLRYSDHVISTGLEYIPHTLVPVTEQQMERAEKLIDHINNYPDVVRIYDNIENYPSSTCKLFVNN